MCLYIIEYQSFLKYLNSVQNANIHFFCYWAYFFLLFTNLALPNAKNSKKQPALLIVNSH